MRYFFGFLLVIFLVLITFILVIRGLSGSSTKTNTANLANYQSTSTVMQFTNDGAINAQSQHQGVRITVGQYVVTMQIYQGYENNVVQSQSFSNNQAAYAEFLKALNMMGYTNGNSSKALADPGGTCPTGDRYTFQIINPDGQNVQNYWATSCGGQGTFKGNLSSVVALFQAQVPNYQTTTSNLILVNP